MADMVQVIWLTKYLGDYNICKYGNDSVLDEQRILVKTKKDLNEQLPKIADMNPLW